MKFIPLGLQCSVPDGIQWAGMREYSYPFDWLWTPSKTTYHILKILINKGIQEAIHFMTTGYNYYKYMGKEHYILADNITECQMNKKTGLGITHFTINNKYKNKLKIRFKRLLKDIKSNISILFIYADAASPSLNYNLDNIDYGLDATKYLLKIYKLIFPLNNNINIVYFCWNKRINKNSIIEYVGFDFKNHWKNVSRLIKTYLIKKYSK